MRQGAGKLNARATTILAGASSPWPAESGKNIRETNSGNAFRAAWWGTPGRFFYGVLKATVALAAASRARPHGDGTVGDAPGPVMMVPASI